MSSASSSHNSKWQGLVSSNVCLMVYFASCAPLNDVKFVNSMFLWNRLHNASIYYHICTITSYVCWGVFCCRQEESPLLGWATQPSIPNCIISHLTFIRLKGYQGLPDELLFVEYILQKGLVLKTMIIDDISLDLSKKSNILNRLYKVLNIWLNCISLRCDLSLITIMFFLSYWIISKVIKIGFILHK